MDTEKLLKRSINNNLHLQNFLYHWPPCPPYRLLLEASSHFYVVLGPYLEVDGLQSGMYTQGWVRRSQMIYLGVERKYEALYLKIKVFSGVSGSVG